MDIKSLPQDVRAQLRSGANINSISQCVTELVLNSLDAKATAIAVRINLVTFRIQVVDNGTGITKSNMNLIGIRYMTSKCQSLSDLKKINRFGFRGEALASIRGMSKNIIISSRSENVENTYSKTHENGKWKAVELVKQRPSKGTTVTVEGFMHNLPVRQKRVDPNLDMHEMKRNLENLSIIHPHVSLHLRNDATGKIVFQSNKTSTVSQALTNLYPDVPIEDLLEIKVTKSKLSVSGLISKNPSPNCKLQFIYLNKRPIVSSKIQNLVNSLLQKNLIYRKPSLNRRPENIFRLASPIEKTEHPIYVINIRCPYSEVDLTLSPSKQTVEFKQWNVVLKCVEKAVMRLLEHENLISTNSNNQEVDLPKAPSFKSQFGISQIQGAVKSIPVKRKIVENGTGLCKKRSKTEPNGNKIGVANECNISATSESVDVHFGNSSRSSFDNIDGQINILAEVHNEKKTRGKEKKYLPLNNDQHYKKKTGNKKLISIINDKESLSSNVQPDQFQKKHSGKNAHKGNSKRTINKKITHFKIFPTITKHHRNKNVEGRPTLLGGTKSNTKRNFVANLNQDFEVNEFGKTKTIKRGDFKTNPDNTNCNIQNLASDASLNIQDINTGTRSTEPLKERSPKTHHRFKTNNVPKPEQEIYPATTNNNIPANIFEKHDNTQSLVLNSELNTTKPSDNPLLNCTIDTNILENQGKGKELIMDMFLKSTLVFPNEQPEMKDNVKETVVVETTKENVITECRKQNTTMMTVSWKLMSKKTIVTNSLHPACNLEESVPESEQNVPVANKFDENCMMELKQDCGETQGAQNTRPKENLKPAKEKMISKCIQTTMIEHQNEFKIDVNCVTQAGPNTTPKFTSYNSIAHNDKYNITFSKYFEKPIKNRPEQYYLPKNYFEFNDVHRGFLNTDDQEGVAIGETNFGFNLRENQVNNVYRHRNPIDKFDNYHPINNIQIPKFGTTPWLNRPFHNYGVPESHNFPTSNIKYESYPRTYNCNAFDRYDNGIFPNYDTCGKNCCKTRRSYFSDYNFDFSNLNACDEPYREFMEQNYNFEKPHQRFPFASRTNPSSNNFINQQQNSNIETCYPTEQPYGTVPLYQINRLNPHPNYHSHFIRNHLLDSINNYSTNWHDNRQYQTKNNVEEHFHPKMLDQNCTFTFINDSCNQNDGKTGENNGFDKMEERKGLEKELYKSIIRDCEQQSCFNDDQKISKQGIGKICKQSKLDNRNFMPEFGRNICLQPSNIKPDMPNAEIYHHKHLKQPKWNIEEENANQKCYSPFFRKPTRKDKYNPKIPTDIGNKPNHFMKNHKNSEPNQNVFGIPKPSDIRCVSPFFHKASNVIPLTESVRTNLPYKNDRYVPLTEISTYHKNIASRQVPNLSSPNKHLFSTIDDQQKETYREPSTKIIAKPCQQYLNNKNILFKEPRKKSFFAPKQTSCLSQKQNDFFFLDQKENQAKKNFWLNQKQNQAETANTKWNQYRPQMQEDINLFARQGCNQRVFAQQQNKQDKLQPNSMLFMNPKKDTQPPQNIFLFPPNKPKSNWPFISSTKNNNNNFPQKSKLSLKKFGTEPPQSKPARCSDVFSKEKPYRPQPESRFQQKSGPTIKKFATEPYTNSEQCPKQYKIGLWSDSKPVFSDLITPKCNEEIEYSFLTPNINKSSTIDNTIEKITLSDSENFEISNLNEVEAGGNLTVCSKNFNPVLSSTRLDAVEENQKSRCSHLLNEKIEQLEVILENCSLGQKRHQNSNISKKSSALNISINEIKKSKLVEEGMEDDRKLNRNSVSTNTEQFNTNSENSGDYKIQQFFLNNAGSFPSVVIHQHENGMKEVSADDEWIKNVNTCGGIFYIHKRTGMTTMFRPQQDSHFNLIKRIEFVPKGFSPIFTEAKKIDASLSPTSKRSLHAVILENYENELNTIKWSNYIYDFNDANAFFEDLYREKTKLFECHIPNAGLNEFPKSMVKLCNKMQAQSFTKDIFIELEIIGQLDKKFIITLLTSKKLIILFDQHAVHERVRLEQLLNDYKAASNDMDVMKFKSTKCTDNIIISFTSGEVNILSNFKNLFENVGLQYSIFGNNVEITHIPTCIHHKFVGSNGKIKDVCLENINSLIYEQIHMVMSTRGVSSKMPNILQNIINSEACRGAIKFGDTLTLKQCEKYIKELSNCQLPFQCAHGRPTLIPVVSVKQNFEKMKPNLKKLQIQ